MVSVPVVAKVLSSARDRSTLCRSPEPLRCRKPIPTWLPCYRRAEWLSAVWPSGEPSGRRKCPPRRGGRSPRVLPYSGSLCNSWIAWLFSPSKCFVDVPDRGINHHHLQHAAWENVVRGDLALIVGVPHERDA